MAAPRNVRPRRSRPARTWSANCGRSASAWPACAPSAPLWRLVRFGDGISAAAAAAVEGALYGAGLLTAWVHPDPALTEAALACAEADGYLVPSARANGRSLGDLLG